MNTATAMLSQMVTKVFERVLVENKQSGNTNIQPLKQVDLDQLKVLNKEAPTWMNESSQDAYMLLQVDLYYILIIKMNVLFLYEIENKFKMKLSEIFDFNLLLNQFLLIDSDAKNHHWYRSILTKNKITFKTKFSIV
jgi:hypothetical protein